MMFPDTADSYDTRETTSHPIHYRPAQYQVGDTVVKAFGDGELRTVMEVWECWTSDYRYRLDGDERYYRQSQLQTLDEWEVARKQAEASQAEWQAMQQARLNPPPPPRFRDYVTETTANAVWRQQVQDYRQAFIEHVGYYYATVPGHLYNEFWRCMGLPRS